MTKNEIFDRMMADMKLFHDTAPKGSNEQQQWAATIQSAIAAHTFAEGKLVQGLAQARAVTATIAGH